MAVVVVVKSASSSGGGSSSSTSSNSGSYGSSSTDPGNSTDAACGLLPSSSIPPVDERPIAYIIYIHNVITYCIEGEREKERGESCNHHQFMWLVRHYLQLTECRGRKIIPI